MQFLTIEKFSPRKNIIKLIWLVFMLFVVPFFIFAIWVSSEVEMPIVNAVSAESKTGYQISK